MSAAETILSPKDVTGAQSDSVQRLVTRPFVRVERGDSRTVLPTLDAASVQCCVTSPPYWGLRDYDHADQIGQETTPEEYVANLVTVFREVRRVLADDGLLWLNLGDSYFGSWGNYSGQNRGNGSQREITNGSQVPNPAYDGKERMRPPTAGKHPTLKPKDLCMIPARVALALQADGWWLRSDIIWNKPNPMPESVTDRCTRSHEHVFMLSKSERYFFDAAAIREPVAPSQEGRVRDDVVGGNKGDVTHHSPGGRYGSGNKAKSWGSNQTAERANGDGNIERHSGIPWEGTTRNKRDVWTVTTSPYAGAHFATFPPALILPCILAGCPVGGTVLDPFGGSGTTGMVAYENGRSAVLIELNQDYAKLINERLTTTPGLPLAG